jgi:polyphosphate kinase
MTFTAIIKNFYTTLMLKLSQKDNFQKEFALTATSRLKRFIFRIVQVPFKWVHGSKEWVLQLFTSRPYDILQT